MLKLLAIISTLFPTLAFAHHPLGGETPSNIIQGFLSGIGHPVIGFDHLAFVIAAGLAAAFTAHRLVNIAAFAAATVAGCLLFINGVTLPFVELAVTASGVIIGGLVLANVRVSAGTLGSLFAVAGLFHGSAYANAIVGAETTPLVAYLVAFASVQALIAYAAGALTHKNVQTARLIGAVCAGVALAFFIENVESLVFAV